MFFSSFIRNILTNKTYTAIMVLGLAFGIYISWTTLNYASQNENIDTDHRLSDRLYVTIYDKLYNKVSTWKTINVFPSIKKEIDSNYQEVEKTARINFHYTNLYLEGDTKEETLTKSFDGTNVMFVDTTFTSMIDIKILKGQQKGYLTSKNSVIISEKLAKKLFGNENPIGKIINRNREGDFTVTAVFKIETMGMFSIIEAIFPYHHFGKDMQEDWNGNKCSILMLLKPNIDFKKFDAKLTPLLQKNKATSEPGITEELHILPISKLAYEKDIMQRMWNVDSEFKIFIWALTLALLLIACFNFINISIGRSSERAKEVGIRKIVGASLWELRAKFLLENVILVFASVFIAILLKIFVGPHILNALFYDMPFIKQPEIEEYIYEFSFWKRIIQLSIITILICSLYPAFVLTKFKPTEVLKGKMPMVRNKKINLASISVVMQFAIAGFLLMITLAFVGQTVFVQNTDIGMNYKNVFYLELPKNTTTDSLFKLRFNSIKNEFASNKNIDNITYCTSKPGFFQAGELRGRVKKLEDNNYDNNTYFQSLIAPNYFDFWKIKLILGRNFDPKLQTDATQSVVISQKCVNQLGYKSDAEALGKIIVKDQKRYSIIGIVANVLENPQSDAKPMIYNLLNANNYLATDWTEKSMYFKLNTTENKTNILLNLKSKFKKLFPNSWFYVQDFEEVYEQHTFSSKIYYRNLIQYSFWALLIACMGIYGLSMLILARKTKEISVRKVLGATQNQLLILLNRKFLTQIAVGLFVAIPIAFVTIQGIFSQITRHTDIQWWWFVLPIIVVILLAILTISGHVLRTIRKDAIESLRLE